MLDNYYTNYQTLNMLEIKLVLVIANKIITLHS